MKIDLKLQAFAFTHATRSFLATMAETYESFPLPRPTTAVPPLNASELPAGEFPETHINGMPNTRPVPETPPAIPPRPPMENTEYHSLETLPEHSQFQPPPKRRTNGAGDITHPVEYTRNPQQLIAYLVPFPTPDLREGFLQTVDPVAIPNRFLIYTPSPPPLLAPKEGEKKEGKLHKVQRKWQQEVRKAKTSDIDKKSWRGIRYASSRGVDRGIGWVTTSNLDFLCRIPKDTKVKQSSAAASPANGESGNANINGSGRLEELVLVHPNSLPGTADEVQREFISSLQRSKKRAYRDAIIATVLFPVAIAIDTVAVIIWPFGGLAEIDAVWAICSIRGAKRARAVTKRLDLTSPDENEKPAKHDDKKLKLTFTPTERLEVLRRYLAAECHKRDPVLFKYAGEGVAPTEAQVLEALGWAPSQNTTDGETRNWEDEQWEIRQAKEDLQLMMRKGAKEWMKWCKTFQKKPDKALKK